MMNNFTIQFTADNKAVIKLNKIAKEKMLTQISNNKITTHELYFIIRKGGMKRYTKLLECVRAIHEIARILELEDSIDFEIEQEWKQDNLLEKRGTALNLSHIPFSKMIKYK